MFDPKDFENGSMGEESGKMPRLTIMEEVLLLGLKDKQVGLKDVRGVCLYSFFLFLFFFSFLHSLFILPSAFLFEVQAGTIHSGRRYGNEVSE